MISISMKQMNDSNINEMKAIKEKRKSIHLYKHLKDYNPKNRYEFKRLVNIFTPDDIKNESCIDTEPLFMDQIELNFRFNEVMIE